MVLANVMVGDRVRCGARELWARCRERRLWMGHASDSWKTYTGKCTEIIISGAVPVRGIFGRDRKADLGGGASPSIASPIPESELAPRPDPAMCPSRACLPGQTNLLGLILEQRRIHWRTLGSDLSFLRFCGLGWASIWCRGTRVGEGGDLAGSASRIDQA